MPYPIRSERDSVQLFGPRGVYGLLLTAKTQGQLCYQITKLCQDYLNRHGESFSRFGEIRNAIEAAWEVHFAPKLKEYEKKKKDENGDVF
jgi:hypothetical protein